jgi:hypothetical protein
MTIYVRTSAFTEHSYSKGVTITLAVATNLTPELISHALTAVQSLYNGQIKCQQRSLSILN